MLSCHGPAMSGLNTASERQKMIDPKMCYSMPPLIFTGKNVEGKTVHSVSCLMCGRSEISRYREIAVIMFNNRIDVKRADGI